MASPINPMASPRGEIRPLTGIRGWAAVIVMLYHFLQHSRLAAGHVPSLIQRGYLGVDMFFVLSGFVMAMSYGRRFADGASLRAYAIFVGRRLARVYPLYLVITMIFAVKYRLNLSGVWTGGFHLQDFIACAMMVQAWGFGFTSVAGATWSLSAEFFAYLVFPILCACALSARRWSAWFLLAAVLLGLASIMLSNLGVNGQLDVVNASSFLPLVRCLAGFSLGLLSYRIANVGGLTRALRSSWSLAIVLAVLLLAASVSAPDWVLFACFPLIILMLFHRSAIARLIFGNRLSHHIGTISYSIYLIHPLFDPLKIRLTPVFQRHLVPDAGWIVLLLMIALSWSGACVLYLTVELPGRNWLNGSLGWHSSPSEKRVAAAQPPSH